MRPGIEAPGSAAWEQDVERRLGALERSHVSPAPGEPYYELQQAIDEDARSTSYHDLIEAEVPVKSGFSRLSVSVVLLCNGLGGTEGGKLHGAVEVDLGGTPEEGFGTIVSLGPGQSGLSVALLDVVATEWPAWPGSFGVTGRFKWDLDPGPATTVRLDLHVSTVWFPT